MAYNHSALIEALRPFAKVKHPASFGANELPDDTEVRLKFLSKGRVRCEQYTEAFTLGDLRRARQALADDSEATNDPAS